MEKAETEKQPQEKKGIIEKYVESHIHLIEAIGVFAALTAFFITEKVFYVAIITLLITAILTWELIIGSFQDLAKYPIKTPLKMIFFKLLMISLFFSVGAYFIVIIVTTSTYTFFLVALTFGVYLVSAFKIFERYKIFENKPAKPSTFLKAMLLLIVILVVTFAFSLWADGAIRWLINFPK
jgi:hypothetical protein